MRIGFIKPLVSIVLLVVGLAWTVHSYGISDVLSGVKKLSPLTIGFVFFGLLVNAFAAALRFKIIANSTGHPVRFRIALAAVGAGSLAGAVFFQIIGQLIARNIVMRRVSMPFAAIVSVTLYERIFAAVLSGLLAIGGAFYIFGYLYFDLQAGGAELIKIIFGLFSATIGGAILGYGRIAARLVAPLITQHLARVSLVIVGLTLLVQLPMMAAYVGVAHALGPKISLTSLFAASAIVMFAASVPISLAGWGVREMSAIVSLSAIGMAGNDALTAAVIIGAGSMISMFVIFLCGFQRSKKEPSASENKIIKSVNYEKAFAWWSPIIAAVAVLFQLYVPTRSGLLNVNLADPIAFLAGTLFIMKAIKYRQIPQWRVSYINTAFVVLSVVLVCSLLLGAFRFGWTNWALVNRTFGWFVLLAFAAMGALFVNTGERGAFKILLLTYAGATAAVAALEISLFLINAFVIQLPPGLSGMTQIEAFAQNRNAFAFQLLMAMAVALVLVRGRNLRVLTWAVMLVAIWFTGSRSGWISIVFVLAVSVYLRASTFRETITAVSCAASFVAIVMLGPTLILTMRDIFASLGFKGLLALGPTSETLSLGPIVALVESSTQERLLTIAGGLKLFFAHPVFGAGLGAFRNEHILDYSGQPLIIHSTPVWMLAELGLVGLLCFLVPAVHVWATEWREARQEPASAIIVLCFIAFALMSLPADMLYQRTFWLIMGGALALPRPFITSS